MSVVNVGLPNVPLFLFLQLMRVALRWKKGVGGGLLSKRYFRSIWIWAGLNTQRSCTTHFESHVMLGDECIKFRTKETTTGEKVCPHVQQHHEYEPYMIPTPCMDAWRWPWCITVVHLSAQLFIEEMHWAQGVPWEARLDLIQTNTLSTVTQALDRNKRMSCKSARDEQKNTQVKELDKPKLITRIECTH